MAEGYVALYPLFACMTMLMFFESTDRFPNAVWELHKGLKNALTKPKVPLYLEISSETMEAIETVAYTEVVKIMSAKAMEEIERYASV